MSPLTVVIDRLGSRGDGIAETPNGRLHVPFAAPGDQIEVTPNGRDAATLTTLISPGPERIEPACRHFGRCGGCTLQHLESGFVAGWKRQRVIDALEIAGLAGVQVAATIATPPGTRRRATLAAKRLRSGVLLGFAERASHRLVDLAECPVLLPELAALLTPLRALLVRILTIGEESDLSLTRAENGIDLLLTRRRSPSLEEREAIAAFAETHDLARIAWRPGETKPAEPVSERRAPIMRFGGCPVALPPSAFLQPSAEGEAALSGLVAAELDAVGGDIVDLFCGLGTFSLPAARRGRVSGFDGDQAAIGALETTIRAQGLTSQLSATRRDLFRDPLTAQELNRFAAAIIDPPRAGAQAQTKALAASAIPIVVALSCNPATFARDAALLIDGGYQLEHVTPIDQFPWSAHVELAAFFRQP